MTAIAGEKPVGLNERISAMTQLTGALARVRRGGWPLASVWLGLSVAYTAISAASAALGVGPEDLATPGYLMELLAQSAVGGIGSALALRLMIGSGERWLRFDAGLAACAAVIALMTAGFSIPLMAFSGLGSTPSPLLVVAAFAVLVGFVVGAFAWLRLSLWPAGILFGRRDLRPAQAWRLMRRATRGLLGGYVLFGVPFGLVLALVEPTFVPGSDWATTAGTAAMQFAAAAYLIACNGLVATVYDLRAGRSASLAEVFA